MEKMLDLTKISEIIFENACVKFTSQADLRFIKQFSTT